MHLITISSLAGFSKISRRSPLSIGIQHQGFADSGDGVSKRQTGTAKRRRRIFDVVSHHHQPTVVSNGCNGNGASSVVSFRKSIIGGSLVDTRVGNSSTGLWL